MTNSIIQIPRTQTPPHCMRAESVCFLCRTSIYVKVTNCIISIPRTHVCTVCALPWCVCHLRVVSCMCTPPRYVCHVFICNSHELHHLCSTNSRVYRMRAPPLCVSHVHIFNTCIWMCNTYKNSWIYNTYKNIWMKRNTENTILYLFAQCIQKYMDMQ